MGVYGTTYYKAFNGLGKPSIKLEFENNDDLLAFQQRMQDADGGDNPDDTPDGGNFTRGEQMLDRLSRLATGRPYLKATTNTPEGDDGEPVAWNRQTQEFEPVEGYGDTYIVTDLRKRAKKEPGDTKAYNRAFDWKLEDRPDVAIKNFNKDLYTLTKGLKWGSEKETAVKDTNYKYVTLYRNSNGSGYDMSVPIFMPSTFNRPKNTFTGYYIDRKIPVDINQLQHYTIDRNGYPNGYFTKDYFKKVFNNALRNEIALLKKYKDDPNYTKERQKELNKEYNYFLQFYTDPAIYTPDIAGGGILRRYAVEYADINPDGLGAPGDLYLVRDMRTRSRKEPGELAANKNLKFEKQKNDTIKNFNKKLYAAPTLANGNKEINGKTYYPVKFGYKNGKNDRYISEMYLFIPKIYNASENKMRGSWRAFDVVIDVDKLYNIERNPYSGGFQAYEDEATLRENTNNALRQAFADVQKNVDYQKEQIEKEKNSPWKSDNMIAKREKYLKEAYKELKYFIMFYANLGKYSAWIMSDNNGGDYPAKIAEDIPEGYIDRSIFAANLAAIGKTANDTLYNNNELMDCRGLKPTYKILADYSQFFPKAQNVNTFAGVGLNDTKKLIADICKRHYKDCAAIAKHLKADTKLQSVFNLWHWMRHNIRYEYDREGREEVRTPARVWQDRHRGVDCDCLSVLAWCVLKCMGYNPAFELVSFKGKAAPSHILVNLDGIRCDRVWFVFNSLPPGVTGSEIYRITVNEDLAGLFN